MIRRLLFEEIGCLEYVLIFILVAMIVIVVLSLLGPAIGNVWSSSGPYI